MRKYLLLLLAFLLLFPCAASAAEGPGCIGLAFRGLPPGREGRELLEELERRDVRATFFLDVPSWEEGRRILDGGHEIGLTVPEEWNRLSRRGVYRQLKGCRALLPDGRVRLLLPQGSLSDGVRQVAEVQEMTLLENYLDPWADPLMGSTLLSQLQSGDILLLDGKHPELAVNILALLQNRGFRLVAVSELGWFDRW